MGVACGTRPLEVEASWWDSDSGAVLLRLSSFSMEAEQFVLALP